MAAIRKDNLVPIFVHAIYAATNMDKEKVTDSGDVHRKRKMTSSPPSLKRTPTTMFLKNNPDKSCS